MHTLHASLIPSPSRRHPPSKESIKKKRKSAGQETKHACAPQMSALSPAAPQFSNTRPLAQFKKRRERNSHHERGGLGRGEEDRKLPPEIPTPLPRSTTSSTNRAAHLHLKTKEKEREAGAGGKGAIIYTADTLRSFRELLPRHRRSKERTRGTGPKERERARQLFWKRKTTHATGESSQFTVW